MRTLIIAGLIFLTGCGSFQKYEYVNDKQLVATVGSPMVEWEDGYKMGVQKHGSKMELVYSGKDGQTLRLSYREYAFGDYGVILARPAFTQDLTYDLSTSPEIAFKNLRMVVNSASNNEINYKITRGPF